MNASPSFLPTVRSRLGWRELAVRAADPAADPAAGDKRLEKAPWSTLLPRATRIRPLGGDASGWTPIDSRSRPSEIGDRHGKNPKTVETSVALGACCARSAADGRRPARWRSRHFCCGGAYGRRAGVWATGRAGRLPVLTGLGAVSGH